MRYGAVQYRVAVERGVMPSETEPQIPHLGLWPLFLIFLRFGCLAFGGPVAQIAMIRQELVEERRWISSARFNRLLAVMQVLPGPEAHELCVHFGMMARGRIGGVLAGLGFMLPGLVLMLLAGWLYVAWLGQGVAAAAALTGVQIVVIAIIARAVVRIGDHVVEDRWLALIAGFAFAATLLDVPFWLPLVAGGLAYARSDRAWLLGVAVVTVIAAFALHGLPAPVIAAQPAAPQVTLVALFLAGLKGGLLTFGGAYTAIPYVRSDTVGRGWVSDATFLDGVALAGVLPAPLVIFATFTGYIVAGPAGAIAITLGMFLPAFGFSLVFFERLEAVTEHPALGRVLAGVAAAVVGIIAATCLQLGWALAGRLDRLLVGLALFGLALFAAWRLRGSWVIPGIVATGAVAGWALQP